MEILSLLFRVRVLVESLNVWPKLSPKFFDLYTSIRYSSGGKTAGY